MFKNLIQIFLLNFFLFLTLIFKSQIHVPSFSLSSFISVSLQKEAILSTLHQTEKEDSAIAMEEILDQAENDQSGEEGSEERETNFETKTAELEKDLPRILFAKKFFQLVFLGHHLYFNSHSNFSEVYIPLFLRPPIVG